jgi:hypothetical protein
VSIEAILWVLEDAPGVLAHQAATLAALADHADSDGRNAHPTISELARCTRKGARAVMRDVAELLTAELIRPGDPVAHPPEACAPKNYDLAVERCDRPEVPSERARLVVKLVERDGPHCQGCSRIPNDPLAFEVDHVMPRALGGGDRLGNRQLLCGPCNRRKSAMHPDTWLALIGGAQ